MIKSWNSDNVETAQRDVSQVKSVCFILSPYQNLKLKI